MAVRHLIPLLLLAGLTLPATAQSDNDVPLGDLARALRTSDTPSQHDVIDNDNLSDAMEDARTQPLDGTPVFSIKGGSNKFQMSSPDGTCSLSFNANATALISDPIMNRELPQNELAKLDGPAIINSDTLEVSIYNGTGWNLTELTIGLTVIRHDNPDEPEAGSTRAGKLVPAALRNIEEPVEGGASVAEPMAKRSDTTVLYHLKGAAAPLKTTTFREIMASALEPGTEWHWAIVQAKGTPPKVVAPIPGVNLTAPLTLPVLPSLPQPEVKPPALRPPAATIVP
jgi:hypothetical protein